jgi:hypothetical protein
MHERFNRPAHSPWARWLKRPKRAWPLAKSGRDNPWPWRTTSKALSRPRRTRVFDRANIGIGKVRTRKDGFGVIMSFRLPLHSSEEGNKKGDSGSRPEQTPPWCRGLWNERQIDDCREKVSDGISLLKDATGKAAYFYGQIFECGGGGQSPYSIDSNTEQRSQGEKLLKSLDEGCTKLENGYDNAQRDWEEVDSVAGPCKPAM